MLVLVVVVVVVVVAVIKVDDDDDTSACWAVSNIVEFIGSKDFVLFVLLLLVMLTSLFPNCD